MLKFTLKNGQYQFEDMQLLKNIVKESHSSGYGIKSIEGLFLDENSKEERYLMLYEGFTTLENHNIQHSLYTTTKRIDIIISIWGEISVKIKTSDKVIIYGTPRGSFYYHDKEGYRCYITPVDIKDENAIPVEGTCEDCGYTFRDSSHFVDKCCSSCVRYKGMELVRKK